MNIIVVDNLDWKNEGADLGGNPPFDIVNVSGKTFDATVEYLAGSKGFDDVVYLINVHCVFASGDTKKKYDFQQQNGVTVYRHLLKIYEDIQEKLKVAFFSPITVENLVKLKPENAVLEHHSFFSVPFNWNNCVAELQAKTGWKYFNNASENLLSGWSFNGRSKINTNGKNIVVIDDQVKEWKTVFNAIFDNPKSQYYVSYQKNEAPNNEFSLDKIKDTNFKTKIHQADLIISDFYLQESHETDTWKTFAQLEDVSGYRLYKHIKENMNGGIPMLIHSSSSKIRYYQFLDRSGIDDWTAKDARLDVPNSQKQFNYECIKNSIERFTVGDHAEIYEHLKDFWRRIEKLKNFNTANWWYSKEDNRKDENDKRATKTEKQHIIDILTDAYFAIRAYLKREDLFAKSFSSKDNNFTASAIISNLGNTYELLGYSQKSADLTGLNLHLRFFFATRNAASHYASYRYLSIEDALIYFHYWLLALEDTETNALTKFAINGQFHIEQPEKSKFRMLYIWIQFYNSSNRPKTTPEKFEKRIDERMREILKGISHAELYTELHIEGATRGQVVLNWTEGNQSFNFVSEGRNGKLKLSNA
ncbi:MAG: hypothetical protein KDC62_10075 [Aequorivita sp.]|nr:hypothetical protein [Aequorivita sp.]